MNIVFVAILFITALAAIEGTIVATAVPTITADLKGAEWMSWIYTAYLLTSAIATVIFGKLADLFGRKKMLLIGISFFTIGSLLCGLATSMPYLIISRAIQGIGAGSILPITLTMVSELFEREKQRAKAQSYISMVWGVAGVVGPLMGGFLIDFTSWHFIFIMNVPFACVAFYIIAKSYHEVKRTTKVKIDYAGATLFTVGTIGFLLLLMNGSQQNDWGSIQQVGGYIALIAIVLAFIYVEKKVSDPLIPFTLFKNKKYSFLLGLSFCSMALVMIFSAYIPVLGQSILGYSATKAGLMLAPFSLMWTIGAMAIGSLIGKVKNEVFMLIGTICLIIGTAMILFISYDTSMYYLLIASSIGGLGMGLISPLIILSIQKVVPANRLGIATGLNSFSNTFSQSINASICGIVFNVLALNPLITLGYTNVNLAEQAFEIPVIDHLVSGVHGVFTVATVYSCLTCVLIVLFYKQRQQKNKMS